LGPCGTCIFFAQTTRTCIAFLSATEEFYAHSEPVNACCLGKQSSHVLATGGDDCRVNVWKLGKAQPLMSLTGHATEVDSILFDRSEEIVAAGSRGLQLFAFPTRLAPLHHLWRCFKAVFFLCLQHCHLRHQQPI